MKITAVCSHCGEHNTDPQLEFNFSEGVVYYMCPECKKESKITIKAESKPLPRIRRM